MSARDRYEPGPADRAHVEKDGERWVLVVRRALAHPVERVWDAITDPTQLAEWAPFDADTNLATAGATVQLTTAGSPVPMTASTVIERADPPHVLVYTWGGHPMRWELTPTADGTQLTLWTSIDRAYIAMGAAGWHLCLDVLDHLLREQPMGRIVGADALGFAPWQKLHMGYQRQFAESARS